MVTRYLDKEGVEALIRLVKRGIASIETPDLSYLETAIEIIEQSLSTLRKKSETYTKEETNELIDSFPHFSFVQVEELPDPDEARDDVIYLVPDPKDESGNVWFEYILIEGEFEKLGTSIIDLSNLYTKDETYTQEEADDRIIPEISAQLVDQMWFGLTSYFTLNQSQLNGSDTLA